MNDVPAHPTTPHKEKEKMGWKPNTGAVWLYWTETIKFGLYHREKLETKLQVKANETQNNA